MEGISVKKRKTGSKRLREKVKRDKQRVDTAVRESLAAPASVPVAAASSHPTTATPAAASEANSHAAAATSSIATAAAQSAACAPLSAATEADLATLHQQEQAARVAFLAADKEDASTRQRLRLAYHTASVLRAAAESGLPASLPTSAGRAALALQEHMRRTMEVQELQRQQLQQQQLHEEQCALQQELQAQLVHQH